MPADLEHGHEHGQGQGHEHAHHHPQGRVFQAVFPFWMLVGRGGMAREVARAANLSAADVVVDVGCGPGTAVRQARRAGASRVVGVDPDERMLRLGQRITALRGIGGVAYAEGAAEHLPLDDASASVLWAIQSVHHWEDPSRGLREARRVLRPAGRILLMERFVEPGARGLAAHGLTEHDAEKVVAELGEAGFESVTKRTVRLGRRTFMVVSGVLPAE